LHHAVADGASVRLLLDELVASYAIVGDLPPPAPALEYADFAAWERALESSPRGAELAAWWTARLKDARAPLLGSAAARDALAARRATDPQARSPRGDREIPMTGISIEDIRRAARSAATSPFLLALTATLTAAADICGQDDLTVIAPWSRRQGAERDLIGILSHGVVVRARVSPSAGFTTNLGTVSRAWAESLAHAALFGDFLEAGRFRFKVNYVQPLVPPFVEPWPVVPARTHEHFWNVGVTFEESATALYARFTYNRDLLGEDEAEKWCAAIAAELGRAVAG
jgi:hypothetical protein